MKVLQYYADSIKFTSDKIL